MGRLPVAVGLDLKGEDGGGCVVTYKDNSAITSRCRHAKNSELPPSVHAEYPNTTRALIGSNLRSQLKSIGTEILVLRLKFLEEGSLLLSDPIPALLQRHLATIPSVRSRLS